MISLLKSVPSAKRIQLPQLTQYKYNACNPSVIECNHKLLAVYKGVSHDLKTSGYQDHHGGFSRQNYIAEISSDFQIEKTLFVEDRHIRSNPDALNGIEDLRLFKWRNAHYVLGAARNVTKKTTKMVLCQLSGSYFDLVGFLPSRQQTEKNWMPWVKEDELFFIYHSDPHEILKFDGKDISNFKKPLMPVQLRTQFGGSCVMPLNKNFIGIVHRKTQTLNYTHTCIIYGPDFEVVAISPEFKFESERVEFCCGLALLGDQIILSYGIWDSQAVLIKLPLADFFDVLNLSFWIAG